MSEPDAVQTSLGAYLLGALGPVERIEVEQHLAQCSRCREELAELAGLPGLLGRLDQTDLAQLDDRPSQRGSQLLERTLRELTRRRRTQRRRSKLLTAAATALVVVALTTTAVLAVRGTPPDRPASTPAATVSATNAATGIHAQVALTAQPWGTALHLALRGVPPGTHCQLLAVLADGQRQVAGSWQASYEGTASIDGAADAPPNQLTGLEVVTNRGTQLLSIPLPGH